MVKSEFAKVKKVFIDARTDYRAAKLALKEDPSNAQCQLNVDTTKKVFLKAKNEKEAFTNKRKEHSKVESPSKKIKSDPEKYNPERFKTAKEGLIICVTNLKDSITAEKMKKYFGACGGVERLDFPRNEDTDKFVGHVFVKFFTQIGAERAVNMSGEEGYEIYFANREEDKSWQWTNVPKNICYRFVRGFCSQGESCPYVHAGAECHDFENGSCSRGAKCKFSHGGSSAHIKKTKKTNGGGKCYDFLKGTCNRTTCKFSHN